jgi:hypothetical protein
MISRTSEIPDIPESQITPLVKSLLQIIQQQSVLLLQAKEEIQKLKDEIAVLKKGNKKPQVPSSSLEKPAPRSNENEKRPGSAKRSKTSDLAIHNTQKIPPLELPQNAIFKDLHSYVVQDLLITPNNTQYLLERWMGVDGSYIVGKLPEDVTGHFGSNLISFVLYQYYGVLVTRPRLLKQLHEFGIDISKGQLDAILIQKKESFHAEKNDLISVGLRTSQFIQTDDTRARHAGKNGYCTVIANPVFTWFSTTHSKSRVNFLKLLQGQKLSYLIDETSVSYVKEHGGVNALFLVNAFNTHGSSQFDSERAWQACLSSLGICKDFEVRVASEGALLAGLLAQGIPKSLGILSDDAGQFNVLEHALCWIHEERHLKAIVPLTAQNREETELVLDRFWHLYQELKSYRKIPSESQKKAIEDEFDALFKTKTVCDVFNRALSLIYDKKAELLKVLARPEMPLHNNDSEQEIREYVTRRKLSGGTRSDAGKQCRDTFTSLKKTCHKLSISFWGYLRGRLGAITSTVDYLPDLVKQKNFTLTRTY